MLTPASDLAMKPSAATFATLLACTALFAFAVTGWIVAHGAPRLLVAL
jgi:hypothetical protein